MREFVVRHLKTIVEGDFLDMVCAEGEDDSCKMRYAIASEIGVSGGC